MPIFKIIVLLFVLIISIKCTKEEITTREYPRLKTSSISKVSGNSYFNAEFIHKGDFVIMEHGFVFGEKKNPTTEFDNILKSDGNIQGDTFSIEIPTELRTGVGYHVRAYIITNNYKVYGTNINFINP
ncbi:hypothetical protein QVZ41_08315 [Wenyingzhuangia sp. chi5]|uniref:DUF4625 domain-containing protein n=1 Tax=Wenyingzhuangia gilva TaxID=3057677 RepID=A0ABT8VSA1_9FLAO|nr:hypothetical protein [Wenyingzhuangia sp. chi5]MDO3694845.1 hypothetical protein [Wenyingzhuangia sp. chi5]